MPTTTEPGPIDGAELRARAEEQLKREARELAALSGDQIQSVIHELHVYQIELEMQNQQLLATQGELERARERYAELYEFAPVGYLTLDRNGKIRDANLTSVNLLGLERSRLLSTPFTKFVFHDDQDHYYHCWRQLFGSGKSQACELRLRRTGGVVFHARLEGVEADEAGEPVCRLTVSDITEQKRAEEALREHERRRLQHAHDERMRLALEAGELGAWDQDLISGQVVCSERTGAMFGLPPGTALTWEAVVARVHPEDCPRFLAEVDRFRVSDDSGRLEVVFRTTMPDGAVRWLRFVAQNYFAAGTSRLVRRTGVFADITRLKQAEELLESRARHLEGIVQERTARLQEAVNELEHFSYTLVHDLRAPLRAIRGFSHLLLDQCTGLSPLHRQFLERNKEAAGRMDELIVDALNYNQLVRKSFTMTPVDAGALLLQLLGSYPEFQEARANIHLHGVFPTVLGNSALLTQCFSNLLHNALKFVAPGQTPIVHIYAEDLGREIRITVADNGIGIPQHHQTRIFKMFERLNQNIEGTGIGLALVKKAAERMEGTVGVESELGQGSRFWIRLKKSEAKR